MAGAESLMGTPASALRHSVNLIGEGLGP
jgi:hypothetical protein